MSYFIHNLLLRHNGWNLLFASQRIFVVFWGGGGHPVHRLSVFYQSEDYWYCRVALLSYSAVISNTSTVVTMLCLAGWRQLLSYWTQEVTSDWLLTLPGPSSLPVIVFGVRTSVLQFHNGGGGVAIRRCGATFSLPIQKQS